MSAKNKTKTSLVILGILILAVALILASCSKSTNEKDKEQAAAGEETGGEQTGTNTVPQEQPQTDMPTEEQGTGTPTGTETQPTEEESSTEETATSPNATETRVSEVEFYLLFKRSSFVKRTIAEEQTRTYGMEGNESTAASQDFTITVTPLIITRDSVKFKINNYTTKALMEHESDGTSEFEIFVNNIYYRP